MAQESADTTAQTSVTAEETKPLDPGLVEVVCEEIHCPTCAKKISRKLFTIKGVSKVETSVKEDKVMIHLPKDKPVDAATLWQAVLDGGSKPTLIRFADQKLDVEAMEKLLNPAPVETAAN